MLQLNVSCSRSSFMAIIDTIDQAVHSVDKGILVVCRGLEVGVESHHLGDEGVSLLFNLLAGAVLPGVQPLAFTVVDGLWGGRPGGGAGGRQEDGKRHHAHVPNTLRYH